jgi:hypothetical protein
MKLRVAAALALVGSVVLGAPAFAIIDDTTTEPPTTATEPPTTATDPPTTATDPPTTTEESSSTTAAETTTTEQATQEQTTTPERTTQPEEETSSETPTTQSSSDSSGRQSSTTEEEGQESTAPPTTIHEGRSVLAVQQLVVTPLVAGDVIGSNHPDCPGIVKDLNPGDATPVAGEVWIKAGNEHVSIGFQAAGFIIPATFDGKETSHADVCPVPGATTTTTTSSTTTTTQPDTTTSTSSTTSTSTTTSTTSTSSSTTLPQTGQFSFSAVTAGCPEGQPTIFITFPLRPDLHGQVGTLTFSTGGSIELEFRSGETVPIQYPDSAGTGPVTLTYTLGTETATATVDLNEEECEVTTTSTTTSTVPGSTTTTTEGGSTTTSSSVPPPTPGLFSIGGVSPVCVEDVPVVSITFGQRTDLNDSTILIEFLIQNSDGTSGEVVGTAEVVYQAGETIQLIYPGATVDDEGNATDWPGWMLNEDGFWVTDPSDAAFRDGLNIVATALLTDETATAAVEYPPETEACANPPGPFPPGVTTTTTPGAPGTTPPPSPGAPPAGPGLPPTK